ncbi:MAG: hypothetical protein LBL92_03800, partial [Propionibacteriaceae bacterium]|nr:hypothetical protein [Propionibacteriaceae bacterium]
MTEPITGRTTPQSDGEDFIPTPQESGDALSPSSGPQLSEDDFIHPPNPLGNVPSPASDPPPRDEDFIHTPQALGNALSPAIGQQLRVEDLLHAALHDRRRFGGRRSSSLRDINDLVNTFTDNHRLLVRASQKTR